MLSSGMRKSSLITGSSIFSTSVSPAPPASQGCAQGLTGNTQPMVLSWTTARLSSPARGQWLMAWRVGGQKGPGWLARESLQRGLVAKGNIWWTSTLPENQGLFKWSSSERHLGDLTGKLAPCYSGFGAQRALQSMPCLLMQEHLFIWAWPESQSTYSFLPPLGRQGGQINDITGNIASLNEGIWPMLSESDFRSVHQISAFVFAALIPGTFSC